MPKKRGEVNPKGQGRPTKQRNKERRKIGDSKRDKKTKPAGTEKQHYPPPSHLKEEFARNSWYPGRPG